MTSKTKSQIVHALFFFIGVAGADQVASSGMILPFASMACGIVIGISAFRFLKVSREP